MSKEKSLGKNAIMGILNTITNMVFPLFIYIYVSRILQPEGIGLTQLANSVSSYFDLFASLGIPLYAVREVSRIREDQKKQNRAAQEIFWTNLINAILMFAVYFAFISVVYKFNTSFWIFLVYGSIIISNAISVEWYFKANEDFAYITIRNIIVKTICIILILIFVKNSSDIVIYSIIYMGGTFGYSLFNLIVFIFKVKPRPIKFNYFKHLKPALSVFLMSFATTIYCSVDTVMLGYIMGDKGNYCVGIYSSAYKITSSLTNIITAINSIMLPRLAYYYENNETDKIKGILNTCYQFILMLAIPVTIATMIFADNMIYLLSGPEFLEGTLSLIIIAPTILFISLTNLIGIQIFYSSGHVKKTIISVLGGAIINVICNSILIPILAQNGAAIGTLLAEFGVLVIQLIIGKEMLIFRKFDTNIFKIITASIIMCSCAFGLKYLLHLGYIIELLIITAIGVGIYGIILLILKEKNILFVLNKIKSKLFKTKPLALAINNPTPSNLSENISQNSEQENNLDNISNEDINNENKKDDE